MDTELNAIVYFTQFGFSLFYNWSGVVIWVVALILSAIAALFSGAEIALFLIAQGIWTQNKNSQRSYIKVIENWFSNGEYFKVSLKVTSGLFKSILIIYLVFLNLHFWANYPVSATISVLLILSEVLIYILAIEYFPKTLASVYPDKFAFIGVYFIAFCFFIFSPVTKIIYNLKLFLTKVTFGDNLENESSANINSTSEVFADEEEIVKGIVKFGNINVNQILRPRVDVVAIDNDLNLSDVLKIVVESGYSRIPVFQDNFDNVKGVLYVKDLLPFLHKDNSFKWQSLVRPPYFVPESKKVNELLNEFKSSKIHMAVVVDEYGGTLGIATLEDILEEIVGEISDESDEDENYYTKINDYTFVFDAKILLNDFYKILQCDPDDFINVKGDADSLAGLILEIKGEIPARNDEFIFKNFNFKIEASDSRRIKQVKVTLLNMEDKTLKNKEKEE